MRGKQLGLGKVREREEEEEIYIKYVKETETDGPTGKERQLFTDPSTSCRNLN